MPSGKKLLIVANLDDQRQTLASWNGQETGMDVSNFLDLIAVEKLVIAESDGKQSFILDSGRVLCVTDDPNDMGLVGVAESQTALYPDRIKRQCLRAKAMDVLLCLAHRAGEPVDKPEILDEVWGRDAYPTTRTVDFHVCNLRKKLEREGEPAVIRTVRGFGYSLETRD
mgnify:CR=1 FL=1